MRQVLTQPGSLLILGFLQAIAFLLAIRALDVFERQPLGATVALAVWGALIASAFAGSLNEAVHRALPDDFGAAFGPSISGPFVEEPVKALGLLLVFFVSAWAFRRLGFLGFDGVTDGIVYGAAVGLGFSLWENFQFLFLYADRGGLPFGLKVYLLRSDFTGLGNLGHAIYSGCFGAGLGLATWRRPGMSRVAFPLLGLGAGMLMHGIHNGYVPFVITRKYGLATAAAAFGEEPVDPDLLASVEDTARAADQVLMVLDYVFVAFFVLVIGLWLRHQRKILRAELLEEEQRGLVTEADREIVPRYGARLRMYWWVLWHHGPYHWHLVRQLHQNLTDLAFLKWRARHCEGDYAQVEHYRGRVRDLRPLINRSLEHDAAEKDDVAGVFPRTSTSATIGTGDKSKGKGASR